MSETKDEKASQLSQLFTVREKDYGDKYKAHLLEQYKLCVSMADKNSSRRAAANNFFLSLNTLLITIIGILSNLGSDFIKVNLGWVVLAALAGVMFCWIWRANIGCYRALNEAKFKVINAIEQKLPVSAFESEWNCLNQKDARVKYPQLTKLEMRIPIIFMAIYIALVTISLFLIIQNALGWQLFNI